MVYALTITVAAGLLVLALVGLGLLLARRADAEGWPSLGRWRWYPSPLGLLLLLPLAGLFLWRLFPALLLFPILLPFFRRSRRIRMRRAGPRGEDGAIEGQYRPLDDD
ncbi:MAG: hypothetical protein A2148_09160 [Chloroflexi bacterium RBG_16_68_14]|nr:MAG: hypothetical protein A2148_09160 [Chloroflexi bacterium RBG_16_68_14]